jgi:hypothetical protein
MPKDGDRYIENPDFVWSESQGRWIYRPEISDADHCQIQKLEGRAEE